MSEEQAILILKGTTVSCLKEIDNNSAQIMNLAIKILLKSNEKKNKIINEMISEIYRRTHTKEKGCSFQNNENCSKYNSCTECMYEYFGNLIKGGK